MKIATLLALAAAPFALAACGGGASHRATVKPVYSRTETLSMQTVPSAPSKDDPDGAALLGRVMRAYDTVPAVVRQVAAIRSVDVLRHGRVVADWITFSQGPASERWLTRSRGATYLRIGTRPCWQRLVPGDPLARTTLGRPLFDRSTMRVLAPRRTRSGWLLPTLEGPHGAYTSRHTYAIDGRTLHVRVASYAIPVPAKARAAGLRSVIAESWRILRTVPKLPVPTPRCVR